MLVKIEELKNIVDLGNKGLVMLIADNPEDVGVCFQNTSIGSQNKNLMDNGIITIDVEKDAVFLSESAFVTPNGESLFNVKCSEDFIRNKDIPFLFSDFINLCMSKGYDYFRCHIENSEKNRIVSTTFSLEMAVLGGNIEDLRKISIDKLSGYMGELIPFLDGITDETPKSESLDYFGYSIVPYKVEDKEKAYLEIDPVSTEVTLKYVNIEK